MEHRTAGEVRAERRRLTGTALRFGEVSPSWRERFEPGSIRLADAVWLDIEHDRERAVAWHPGGGLELRQDREALRLVADLPPIPAADRALHEVRTGRRTGLSIAFDAHGERRENGIRVVTDAVVHGIAITKAPGYSGSRLEARQSTGFSLASFIPAGRRLDCECSGEGCSYAEFSDAVVGRMMDEAFEVKDELIATFGDYRTPLASKSRGTLRRAGADGFEIDVPQSEAGKRVLEAQEAAGVVVRPFLSTSRQTGRKEGETMIYDGDTPELRALVVSSTDKRAGWPEVRLIPRTPGEIAQDIAINAALATLFL